MKTIEKELFDWQGWDGDLVCMTFYSPMLKQRIGKYPTGTRFDSATIIQTDTGAVLQFTNMDKDSPEATETYTPMKVMGEYKLHYYVGKTIREV